MDILYFILAFIVGFIVAYAINTKIRERKGLEKRGEWEFLSIFALTVVVSYLVLFLVAVLVGGVLTSLGN